MNTDKISVIEYLENKELLEINYTPYDTKVQIVNTIIEQVVGDKNEIDSAFLKRISEQIFIEAITNLDLSIVCDNNLSGYDYLYYTNTINDIMFDIEIEYDLFSEILDCKLNDFYRYRNSTSATLLSLVSDFKLFVKRKSDEVNNFIENIDTKEVSEKIKGFIDENLKKYRGK